MIREEMLKTVELLRDTAKLHQPNEEILTDVKAESFVWVMELVIDALNQEPKIGHWIKREDAMGNTFYECSCCGGLRSEYCPNCGSKMIEELTD